MTQAPADESETATLLSSAQHDLEAQTDTKDGQSPALKKVPKTATAAPSKILFLDGVRGLAALMVVTQHSHEYMQDLNLGACAVDAFFVLSSFLLTMLFMRKSEKLLAQGASYRKWGFTLADYFSKRFFRVYPLFALVATVLWMLPDEAKHRFYLIDSPESYDLFKVLTFDFHSRYFVLWTLPLEISYYFFIPVLVLGVLRLRRLWWVPFIPAYGWVVYEGWYTYRWDHMPLSPHAPTFVAGSMAAVLFVKFETWMKETRFEFTGRQIRAVRAVEFSALSILLSLSFRGLFFHWVHGNVAPTTPGFPFISVLLTVVLVVEMLLPSGLSSLLEWSALRYCGKVSFSIYLLHGFVIYNHGVKTQPSYYDRMFLRLGLTLMLATVSYHLVEYPSQLLAQRTTRYLAKQELQGSTEAVHSIQSKDRIVEGTGEVPSLLVYCRKPSFVKRTPPIA
ncbi:hypothetical protein PHYSODRAFT_487117 [Phytophthora sojae]|uniref:Acyltransferase 3 domain-containing protein n=1 Tax=Phytophthora sojae (strain P6497) TaxID=1094619 RepID=G4YSE8_PHYSP|nr:hypothetical protein PHYSODRAFT_487117 [Phytophthora sojae]EGZ22964.1 hypothetical protein PHYSODRAFT_487117 [Phytophthora sojae]|eukprot:XP_009518252.1 hypothetical protein PHYSODRAFT_487117 [Phytophthora sojae]